MAVHFPHIYVLCGFLLLKKQCDGQNCSASLTTIREVFNCPSDAKSWAKAADEKKCYEKVGFEACGNVAYHCLFSSSSKTFVEVCAPRRFLQGYCAEFNKYKEEIRNNYEADCSTFFEPCPSRYSSTDSYKYQQCYKFVSKNDTRKSMNETNTVSDKDGHLDTDVILLIVVSSAFIICISIIAGIMYYRKKSRNENSQREETNTEEGVPLQNGQEVGSFSCTYHEDDAEDMNFRAAGTLRRLSCTHIPEDADINLKRTRSYMEKERGNTPYFVHTASFHKIRKLLQENRLVTITGDLGAGKKSAAIELLLEYAKKGWIIRRIEKPDDIFSIDKEKKTIAFVDNPFQREVSCGSWWNAFTELSEQLGINEEIQLENKWKYTLLVIITSRKYHIDLACETMVNTHDLLHTKYQVDLTALGLTGDEKISILDGQFRSVPISEHGRNTKVTEELKEVIKNSDPPFGFPLMAHVYAHNPEYQADGGEFFIHPYQYFWNRLNKSFENDTSSSTFTLFLVLLVCKLTKREPVVLSNETNCKAVIENNKEVDKKCDFKRLDKQAKCHLGSFLKRVKTSENKQTCDFLHERIFQIVLEYYIENFYAELYEAVPSLETYLETREKTLNA